MGTSDPSTVTDAVLRERVKELEREVERLRAENDRLLNHRAEFFERLAEWAPVGLAYFDRQLIYRFCNETNAEYIGKPLDQIVGHSIRDVVPNNPSVWETVERVLLTGQPYPLQRMNVVFEGREYEGDHVFLIAFLPDLDETGEARGVYVYAREITDITRTEDALRFLSDASIQLAASLDFGQVMDAIVDVSLPYLADFCVIDIVSGMTAHSRSAAYLDQDKADLLTEIRRRYPIDLGRETPLSRALRTQGSILIEEITDEHLRSFARGDDHLEMLRQIGHRSVVFVPLIARNRMVGIISFGRGLERPPYASRDLELADELARRAAVAIDTAILFDHAQGAEARYRGVFDGVADAILVFDRRAHLVEVNAAATELFRTPEDELIGRSILDLTPAGREWSVRELRRLEEDGRWHGDIDLRRKDGSIVPVEARANRISLPGEILYISVLRDISHRRELDRMQRELTAMVTHELKGPLTTIKGFAQLMQRRGAFDARRVDAILSQANQLERLINDMTDAARAESRQLNLRFEPVDLGAIVREAVDQARTLSTTHHLQLEIPDDPLVGVWDSDRLSQILQNLLSNAIKYSPDGGQITVSAWSQDGSAVVAVSDQGVGIPEDKLERVFERFYRVEGANRGSAQGLGLGLFITRMLVEEHGGQITVQSTPGTSTTFTVRLPLECSTTDEGRFPRSS